jgi:uroporphyrinogen decarboxylase
MAYSSRERVLAAIDHEPLDRVPTDYWGTPEITARLCDHLGCETHLEMYDLLGIDGIAGASPPYVGPPLPDECDGGFWFNVQTWGMRFEAQAVEGGIYWEQVHYPLAEAETIEELEAYPWPDPDWYDYDALATKCEELAGSGRAVEVGYTAPFYYHNMLRGLEESLMDPLLKPEFTHYLMERISSTFTEIHRRCFEAAGEYIDLTQVTDDWGSQNGLLTSPKVFAEFYREPMQRAIDLAKSYGIRVFHHDDGDMLPLLPSLVEMGIDVLNPLQWRCGDWDLAALKAEFGKDVCFHGGVDNQQTLPFGTPGDVRAEVKRLIEALASDGTGYILAPCHNVQPITPVENVVALYEAAREYGKIG